MTIAGAAAPSIAETIQTETTGREDSKRPLKDWEAALRVVLCKPGLGSIHMVGVGNTIRRDDGVGIRVVQLLRRRLGASPRPNLRIHGPGSDPERLISRLALRGDRLVVFDAVEANKPPGEIMCARIGDVKFGYFATHNIPLTIVPGLAGNPEAGIIVGIQPGSLEVAEGLTPAVEAASRRIVDAVEGIVGGTCDG